MDKTDAVNECLRARGLLPVTRYDDPSLFAATAWQTIDRVQRKLELEGWWFNTEHFWRIAPNSNNEIEVPNNIIELVSAGVSTLLPLVIKGDRIYDTYTHSYKLGDYVDGGGYIYFTFLTHVDFNELPATAAEYFSARGKRVYLQEQDGDANKVKISISDEQDQRKIFDKINRKSKKSNMLRNSKILSKLGYIGGPNALGGVNLLRNLRYE